MLVTSSFGELEIWSPPARQQTIHALHWIYEHWLNNIAITAFATCAAALVPIILWRLDRHHATNPATARAGGAQARSRAILMRRVRMSWIKGVLEPSLAEAARLALGLQHRPDALTLGSRVIRRAADLPAAMPPGTDVYDETSGSLLILGAPGAGKTTLLLQLADALLERAERDPAEPVPVVFNLSSWAKELQPLGTWLISELAASAVAGHVCPPIDAPGRPACRGRARQRRRAERGGPGGASRAYSRARRGRYFTIRTPEPNKCLT